MYILPKDKQSMIYMAVYQVQNPLDKRGKEDYDIYPYNGVWINDQETFCIALPMFLLIFEVPQSCFEVAMIWCLRLGLKVTRNTQGTISRIARNLRYNQNMTKSGLEGRQGC